MSGQRKAPRPVGRGYMPKGGAAAAAAKNQAWHAAVQASRAVESAQPHTTPVEWSHAGALCAGCPSCASVSPVQADSAADGGQTYGRASDRESGRRSPRFDWRSLPLFSWLCLAGALAAVILLVSAVAASADAHVDCVAFPDDPACVTPSPSPPPPTATETVTVTASPEPVPVAPGEPTGVFLDPSSGSLNVDENTGVALGVACWLAAVVAGLGTAWMVLP